MSSTPLCETATVAATTPISFSVTCTNERCKMNVFGKPDTKLMSMPSVGAKPPSYPYASLPLPFIGSGGGKGRPFPPVNG